VIRWLVPLALLGCTPTQATILRTVGYGLTIEGGAVVAATYVAQSPHDSIGDAMAIASPLIVAGVIAIVAGRPVPHETPHPR
jgi:hypothetical protein